MSILAELAGRSAALLVVLAALGSAPAALLPRRVGRRARVAMAPVLGLCLAACLFTTLEWFVPADRVAFVVPLACALSLAGALARGRGGAGGGALLPRVARLGRTGLLGGVQVLLVVAAAFLPIATALAAHQSVGPMSYEVFDGPGYVANAEAAQHLSIRAAAAAATDPTKATAGVASTYVGQWWIADAASSNRLDYAPVVAAVDGLLGLDATGTWAADLLAVVAAGALAMYGAVQVATAGRTSLFAVLAGAAFGGSFFMQLVFDGSQAAITGLVVVVPLVLVTALGARDPSRPTLAVCALLVAGMATLYPILLFPLVLATGLTAALALVRGGRQLGGLARAGLAAAPKVVGVLVLAGALDVVATVRDARSLASIATGGGVISSFPVYHLGAGVVPGWLLQTRDLYGVAFGPQSPLADLLPALVVPLAVVLVAASGLRRKPGAVLALSVVGVSLALGAYEAAVKGCSYCEDRSLLAAFPPLVFLVFTGLAGAVGSARGLARVGLAGVAVVFLGVIANDAASARTRLAGGSFYVTSSLRALVGKIPPSAGAVELEGFGAAPSSMAAEPYLYELVAEHVRVVSAVTVNERTGLAEDWGPRPVTSPVFHPGYTYVLTRLAGVATSRAPVASAGVVALERREHPEDVTVSAGLAFASQAGRRPVVTGPVSFVVTGPSRGPETVRARFSAPAARLAVAALGHGEDGSARLVGRGSRLVACVPVTGRPPARVGVLSLPAGLGLRLRAMTAAPGRC